MTKGAALSTVLALVAASIGLASVVVIGTVSSGLPCTLTGTVGGDDGQGSPTIEGVAALTANQLDAWWLQHQRGPTRLTVPIEQLIGWYLSEGAVQDVRGDLAFAQAIVETGDFTSPDTARNNFAGIGHPDAAQAGLSYPDPRTGVRAHIQLLAEYGQGNNTPLVYRRVAPLAAGRAATWSQLAGTWAADPTYWSAISTTYSAMLASAGFGGPFPAGPNACTAAPLPHPNAAGTYALPVDLIWWQQHPDWFGRPHRNYPAVDIPVPAGTPVYSVIGGTVISAPVGGDCGLGVLIDGDDGVQYGYCHGLDGGQLVEPDQHVLAGQLIMHAGYSGDVQPPGPTGAHVHFQINAGGAWRCPQPFLRGIFTAQPVNPYQLPTTGCVE